MVKETKAKAEQVLSTSKRVIRNSEQFVQAVSLLTVAAFSYNQLHTANLSEPLQWVITGALAVIGLRGAYELFRFLDK